MTVVVIGSGPAGAAAAHALCDAGLSVTVLDAGDRIEPGKMDLFDALARSEPARWPPGLARRARDAFPADVRHVPLKPAFSSLFPYVIDDPDLPLVNSDSDALSSLAYGGLSNAWGASMLPYRQRDIEDWPISLDELRPHYEAVQRFVPVAAESDELCATLPLYTDTPRELWRSRQAQRLLEHLRRHARALEAAGFTFGSSRLAVFASEEDPRRCRHCGMCLYGCPYGSIYNAAHTFDALRNGNRLDYRGGVYVDRVTESGGTVRIDFHERGRPAARGQLSASRVFIACGAISSTRLMLASMRRAGHVAQMRDSQYFVIPMVTAHAEPVSVATQGNTLAQVFVELEDPRLTAHAMHLQVYGYNDIMLSALARRIPLPSTVLERILRPALGRLLVIQGFLHSADSPGLAVGCDIDGVRIVGEDVAQGVARVKRLVRRLAVHGRLLGMAPIPGLAHVGRPGKSNHLGGSLAMRREPRELETDVLGRIPTWRRVHVIDASIFPSVPATTVTLTVMANAHRIATAAVRSDVARD
jgi:choline dehydrogenase-like flavoprotein